jgi:nucleotide-binding universal stress UspA family protein
MSFKHLLVHVDSTPGTAGRLGLAVALARRFSAKLTGLFAESDSLGASIVGRRSPEHHREAALAARNHFATQVGEAKVDAEWWRLGYEGHAELVGYVTACCRYVDLAIFGQQVPQSRVPHELVEHVVAECGRPVMVVPAEGRVTEIGRRVVVGWNASRGAARALNDALPLLKEAELVAVLSFQAEAEGEGEGPMPPASIVNHLLLHGVKPTYERAVAGLDGIGVAEALLNYEFEAKADLAVVGVHPHGAFRHDGFTARDILARMTAPVLLGQ